MFNLGSFDALAVSNCDGLLILASLTKSLIMCVCAAGPNGTLVDNTIDGSLTPVAATLASCKLASWCGRAAE